VKTMLVILVVSIVSLSLVVLYIDHRIQKHVELRKAIVKENSREYNLKLLGGYLIEYASNNEGRLPLAANWCDLLMAYSPTIKKEDFQHPKRNELGLKECNFAFNKKLSGLSLDTISPDTILIFEADGEWNLSGTNELLQPRYSEDEYISVLYVNQKIHDYWFYKAGIRDFSNKGASMFYAKPKWNP